MSHIKIVYLIDDEESLNIIAAKTMDKVKFAHTIKTFESGTAALAQLRQLSLTDPKEFPDVIFVDINMPEMSGWDFLDSIKNFSDSVLKNCKLIMLTSSIEQADINHAKNYEMVSDFISKPLTVTRLESLITCN